MTIKSQFEELFTKSARYAFPHEDGYPAFRGDEASETLNFFWDWVQQKLEYTYKKAFEAGVRDLHKSFLEEGVMPKELESVGIQGCATESLDKFLTEEVVDAPTLVVKSPFVKENP